MSEGGLLHLLCVLPGVLGRRPVYLWRSQLPLVREHWGGGVPTRSHTLGSIGC